MKRIIPLLILLLVGCGDAFPQGQITRPGKQTSAPAKPKPGKLSKSQAQKSKPKIHIERQIDGIKYSLQSSSLTCEVIGGDYSGDIIIPEFVSFNDSVYKVTQIAKEAFAGCHDLTSVTIPNSVTTIGSWAFQSCSRLNSVIIPNSVTEICEYAFFGCNFLMSITISNSVTKIGSGTFQSCSQLMSLTIPNSVTEIDSDAFAGCRSLTSLTIPNSVIEIGSLAFYDCQALVNLQFETGNNEISISKSAFEKTPVENKIEELVKGKRVLRMF